MNTSAWLSPLGLKRISDLIATIERCRPNVKWRAGKLIANSSKRESSWVKAESSKLKAKKRRKGQSRKHEGTKARKTCLTPAPSGSLEAQRAPRQAPAQNLHRKLKHQDRASSLLLLPLPEPRAVALRLFHRLFEREARSPSVVSAFPLVNSFR